jgi:adenine-specific DNA methylase
VTTLCNKLGEVVRRRGNAAEMEKVVECWIMGLPQQSLLKKKLRESDEQWIEDKYKRYINHIAVEIGTLLNNISQIYRNQSEFIKSKGMKIESDPKILSLISTDITANNWSIH